MSVELEKIIIASIMHNPEFRAKVYPFIKVEYFNDAAVASVVQLVKNYNETYNSFPNKDSLTVELDDKKGLTENQYQDAKKLIPSLFSEEMQSVTRKVELQWLLDKTEKYLKTQSCHNAVMASISILDGENKKLTPDAIPDILKEALAISFDTNVGHDYINDFESRFEFYHRIEETIPFRLTALNAACGGTGVPRKTLVVPVAPTGVGKSLFLTDDAAFLLEKGYNVLYVTLEMAEERIAERIDANLMNITMGDLKTCPKSTFDSKINTIKRKPIGAIKIKEYPPGTFNANHLRYLLHDLKNKSAFVPDVIMVDYLNLLASYRMKDASNSYSYIKAVAEEIRGIAMEFDCVVIAPTQTNRSGQNASDFELNEVSESHGISMTADVMIGLIATPELEELNQLRMKMLKNRFGQAGVSFLVAINRSKMQLRDLDNLPTSQPQQQPRGKLNDSSSVNKPTGFKF